MDFSLWQTVNVFVGRTCLKVVPVFEKAFYAVKTRCNTPTVFIFHSYLLFVGFIKRYPTNRTSNYFCVLMASLFRSFSLLVDNFLKPSKRKFVSAHVAMYCPSCQIVSYDLKENFTDSVKACEHPTRWVTFPWSDEGQYPFLMIIDCVGSIWSWHTPPSIQGKQVLPEP